MSTITVNAPIKTTAPRGAAIAARWFVASLAWMEKSADRREQTRQFVGRVDEAARVRSYAQQVMSHDPRFAADLFAAADRHERS